jgi:MoxR-like ATPase
MADLAYRKLFDPTQPPKGGLAASGAAADRAPPNTYLFDEALVLAINVALAARRPLLLHGTSGVGKTSVARAIAWRQGWSFVSIVVTSRSLARDFLYQIDDLKRLQDAYARRPIEDMQRYLVPGPIFWAFDPDYARSILTATGRGTLVPSGIVENAANTVVLVDEIDKADPDVPNNLLEPLGQMSFEAPELARPVVAPPERIPLLVITTNEERDLPAAFLRRCIEHRIDRPDAERLRQIGEKHFKPNFNQTHHNLVAKFDPKNPAEYLDALRACDRLAGDATREADLQAIVQAVLRTPATDAGP